MEIIDTQAFQWRSGGLVATSQKVYKRVGRVKVKGLGPQDIIILRSVDLTGEDHTLLLPIWAGIPDRQRVQIMLSRTLLEADRFGRPFGIPALPALPSPEAEAIGMSVHLPWNNLIGEGLLEYGFRQEAALLTVHLMNAVIQSLKQTRSFYQRYHAEDGSGIGERNALSGFAPVGLFLGSLGVTLLSPNRLRLEGSNPFPWPVTLKYRGLIVQRGMEFDHCHLPQRRRNRHHLHRPDPRLSLTPLRGEPEQGRSTGWNPFIFSPNKGGLWGWSL